MKFLRRLHTYLGVFFAPLLLFYVATGWYQTVTIQRKGVRPAWRLGFQSFPSHVDQIYPTERGAENGYSPDYAES
jgi:hypothetical protein